MRFRNTFVTLVSQLSVTPPSPSHALQMAQPGNLLQFNGSLCARAPRLHTVMLSTELYSIKAARANLQCLITRNAHQDQYLTVALL